MASTTVQSALGGYLDHFAVAGVVAVSYCSFKLALSILNGIKVFFLSGPLGLAINLRKTGEWAVVTGSTGWNRKGICRTESKYKVKTKIIVADFSRGPEIYPINNVGLGYDYPEYYLDLPNRNQHVMDLLHVNVTSVVMAFVDFFSVGLREEYRSRGITVQCVMPYFVATKMSKMRKTNIAVPSTTNFAVSALNSVGVEDRTNGYWTHSIMLYTASASKEITRYI
ncbi:hypothetical protein KUTeg_023601 [Tegillarca granosa]|uniref:Uncharacterized protein n=1 Tax=Tegillarca granosa TaxID=220873 RepID=A0ABQ9E253_TEGGR|nr:hypothetical protein KUTeg_023601 [Tegillarca granosa]